MPCVRFDSPIMFAAQRLLFGAPRRRATSTCSCFSIVFDGQSIYLLAIFNIYAKTTDIWIKFRWKRKGSARVRVDCLRDWEESGMVFRKRIMRAMLLLFRCVVPCLRRKSVIDVLPPDESGLENLVSAAVCRLPAFYPIGWTSSKGGVVCAPRKREDWIIVPQLIPRGKFSSSNTGFASQIFLDHSRREETE